MKLENVVAAFFHSYVTYTRLISVIYAVPLAVRLAVVAFLRVRCLLNTRFQQLESAKVSGKSRTLQEFKSIEFPATAPHRSNTDTFYVYLHGRLDALPLRWNVTNIYIKFLESIQFFKSARCCDIWYVCTVCPCTQSLHLFQLDIYWIK